ncbi:hypothetical protein [Lysinibacillus boronitolerans]|uniref:Alpha-ribazole-5-phosphate synthase n=1 Tax=Lysinibacillus boronitolerans JCM 21713 = 10a = NBRC 103108 TaxID=1294264 RepID=A0ABR4XTI2_9BACI|nr:hypothetical protein [Lysinibacillus boronitolerans]KGR80870.1 hypothetical protein CD31_22510 [Lysinibacillus boronitolerans JCM 21713 = 10a = NBRC 103108]
MRNAMKVGTFIATMDNAAAIGQKPQDVVSAPDQLTAYMTARVTFLEQLAAQALPVQVLLANFSGDAAWSRYEKGIQQVFTEAGLTCPAISGSTESNMPTLQSGLAITMLGEIQQRRAFDHDQLSWYTYGLPLVGEEVLAQPEDVAQLLPIFQAWQAEIIQQVWPVGSKGLQGEFARLFGERHVECALDGAKSAGPCTVILLGIAPDNESQAQKIFLRNFEKLRISVK